MTASKTSSVQQVWRQAATSLSVVVIAMLGFWLVEGRNFVTFSDLETRAPYIRDRQLILDAIATNDKMTEALTLAITGNTTAISELRVVIAELKTEMRVRNEDDT